MDYRRLYNRNQSENRRKIKWCLQKGDRKKVGASGSHEPMNPWIIYRVGRVDQWYFFQIDWSPRISIGWHGPKNLPPKAASQSQSQPSKFGDLGFFERRAFFFFGVGGKGKWHMHSGVIILWTFPGWWSHFFFHPLFGEDSHFDDVIFFKRVETTNQFCCWHLIFQGKCLEQWDDRWYYNLDLTCSHPGCQWQIKVLVTIPEPRN